MAKKNQEPESKPEESSDSDELVTESGSESGSESEEEPAIPTVSESLSGSETGSDSDSDAESSDSKHKIEPAATPELPNKAKAVGVKRVAEKGAEPQVAKKAKKVESSVKKDVKLKTASVSASASVGVGIEDSSKKLFQRVFSEEDEIVLLKGMSDFIAKKKSDPVSNVDQFMEVVKKKLHLDVTKAQLLNKMKRLKGKYKNHTSKVKDGLDVKISKPHERESYELSKKIWGGLDAENGDGGVNGSVVKKGGNKHAGSKVSAKTDDVAPVKDDQMLTSASVGPSMYAALEQRIMSVEIENVDEEKKRELKKKLCEIEMAELELSAKRFEYMAEKAMLILAAKKAEL